MTLQELSKQYKKLHEDVTNLFSFSDYVFTYGTREEYDELNKEAEQLEAETNPEAI